MIKSTLARHTGVRRVCVSRQSDHVLSVDQSQSLFGTYSIQPNGCTWVVLWLFCFRSTPQRSLIYGPLSRVLFGESLVIRLYSEIDQTYLSIEAQCVSHYYPGGLPHLEHLERVRNKNKTKPSTFQYKIKVKILVPMRFPS